MSDGDSGVHKEKTLSNSRSVPLTRRRMIEAMGVASIAGMAGCGSGSDDDTPTTDPNSDGTSTDTSTDASNDGAVEILDQDWVFPVDRDTQNVDWNPRNQVEGPIFEGMMFQLPMATFDTASAEYVGILLDDWTLEADSLTLTFDERYTWGNGDPITADDYITQEKIAWHSEGNKGQTESLEKVDEQTVRINFTSDTVNPGTTLSSYMGGALQMKHDVFSPYLETLEEARGDMSIEEAFETDEHAQAVTELNDFIWRPDDDETPEVVTSGPYQPVSQSQQRIVFELNEDHVLAANNEGELNFKRCIALRTPADNEPAGWADDEFDGRETGAAPEEQLPPDVHDKIIRNPVQLNMGRSLWINHTDPWTTRRGVRQAMMYVIDRDVVVDNYRANNPSRPHMPVDYPTYLVGHAAGDPYEIWLGESYQEEYRPYNVDHDAAAAALEDEGFTQEGSSWLTPEGDTWTPTIGTSTTGNALLDTINSQFQQFGIESELVAYDPTSLGNAQENGEFQIGTRWFGWGGSTTYPYFTLYTQWDTWEQENHGHYMNADEEVDTTVEVPWPIGDWEGDTEEFEPIQLLRELENTADEERETEIIRTLCWISNVDLPSLPIYERFLEEAIVGEPDWNLAPDDDPVWNYGQFATRQHFYHGKISAPSE